MTDSPQGTPAKMEEARKRRNREHTNSKYGCAQCKARKVKCDESKPKCRSCVRRGTQCHYQYGPPNGNNGLDELARLATSSPHSNSTSYNNVYHPHPNYHMPDDDYYRNQDRHTNLPISGSSPYPSRPSPHSNPSYQPQPPVDPYDINMNHFELFHYFLSSTAATIAASPATEKLWSVTIPRLALSHHFLMHSILAISALDIANANPSQSTIYCSQAITHGDRAFALAQPDIANPSAENADVLFAFILTTAFYAFGAPEASTPHQSPTQEQHQHNPLQGVVQCINILRSLRNVMPFIRGWVEGGPLAPLLNMQSSSRSSPQRHREHNTEEHWSNLLLFASTTSTAGPKELEDIEICSAAASSLRASYSKLDGASEGEFNAPPIWHWAVRLPGDFVDRLAQLDAVPLVLVAHWCALLPQPRQYWWTREWVDRTMGDIRVVLPEKYRSWLDWPTEKIKSLRGTQKDLALDRILATEEELKSGRRSGVDEDAMVQ